MGKNLINATWNELFKLRLEQDDFLSSTWEIIVSKDGKYKITTKCCDHDDS